MLLIDGYNLIAPVAAPARGPAAWLHRERKLLLDRLAKHLPHRVRNRCCVVFDAAAPPLNASNRYELDGIEVRFAVDYAEADDLLEELIATHTSPKQLAVISSDHRVQAAARQRGATVFESQLWLDDLLCGRVSLATLPKNQLAAREQEPEAVKPNTPVDKEELDDWLREFGFDDS